MLSICNNACTYSLSCPKRLSKKAGSRAPNTFLPGNVTAFMSAHFLRRTESKSLNWLYRFHTSQVMTDFSKVGALKQHTNWYSTFGLEPSFTRRYERTSARMFLFGLLGMVALCLLL